MIAVAENQRMGTQVLDLLIKEFGLSRITNNVVIAALRNGAISETPFELIEGLAEEFTIDEKGFDTAIQDIRNSKRVLGCLKKSNRAEITSLEILILRKQLRVGEYMEFGSLKGYKIAGLKFILIVIHLKTPDPTHLPLCKEGIQRCVEMKRPIQVREVMLLSGLEESAEGIFRVIGEYREAGFTKKVCLEWNEHRHR